jgi:two-component system chemotaxis sensor kinase CheA
VCSSDLTVVDEIGESLVHLIRNALDHGIETPEEREAKGKKREGTVRIAAYQEGNSVIVEVADDGCGIDADLVRRKAVEKGLYSAEEAQALSDEDAIKLIFLPGFSTADKVSDLSGRGVGMDVVKSKVESLGGQFAVHSKLDRGTRVVIRLPLTLAIVLALLVSVGDEVYAIPLEDVEETLLVNKNDIRSVHGTPVVTVRGEILSLQSLAGLLRAHSRLEADEFPVVVVRVEGKRRGLIVDELIGQQEIVIKPLGKLLSKVQGIAGATILGDGNVALILDVASLGSRPERAVTYEARMGAPQ